MRSPTAALQKILRSVSALGERALATTGGVDRGWATPVRRRGSPRARWSAAGGTKWFTSVEAGAREALFNKSVTLRRHGRRCDALVTFP